MHVDALTKKLDPLLSGDDVDDSDVEREEWISSPADGDEGTETHVFFLDEGVKRPLVIPPPPSSSPHHH